MRLAIFSIFLISSFIFQSNPVLADVYDHDGPVLPYGGIIESKKSKSRLAITCLETNPEDGICRLFQFIKYSNKNLPYEIIEPKVIGAEYTVAEMIALQERLAKALHRPFKALPLSQAFAKFQFSTDSGIIFMAATLCTSPIIILPVTFVSDLITLPFRAIIKPITYKNKVYKINKNFDFLLSRKDVEEVYKIDDKIFEAFVTTIQTFRD